MEQKIINLWRDPSFAGSYRGLKTFQMFLKTDKNIDVSERKLFKIMSNDPIYVMHMKSKKVKRRQYYLSNIGELVQSDLAYMFDYKDFKYFVVFIDCFSYKLNIQPLKNKTAQSVLKAFELFCKGNKIEKLETDLGTEYSLCKKFCKKNKILYSFKRGQNKANFAEYAILQIKKRLYKMLRGNLTQDWPSYLQTVEKDFNKTPMKMLGNFAPEDINDSADTYLVLKSQEQNHLKSILPSFEDQQKSIELYNKNKQNLKIDDYVYLNFKLSVFSKSFDIQVSNLGKKFLIITICMTLNHECFRLLRFGRGFCTTLFLFASCTCNKEFL
jgi:hypothetical protein